MVEIDGERHEVTYKGLQIPMEPKAFKILSVLKAADGRVLTRKKILELAWGKAFVSWDPRIVDQHVARIRRQLKKFKAQGFLVTVSGAGYKFKRA